MAKLPKRVPSNVIKYFQSRYRKSELFKRLRIEFNLDVDDRHTVNEALERALNQGKEKQLMLSEFEVESFKRASNAIDIRQGLRMLENDELQSLLAILPCMTEIAKTQTKPSKQLIEEISKRCTKKQVDASIKKAIEEDKLPRCSQDGYMTMGPLGIKRSVEVRYMTSGIGIDLLLETIVGFNKADAFLNHSNFIGKATRLSSGSQLGWDTFLQQVLIEGTDEEIIGVLNSMIDDGEIKIAEIQQIGWEYVCTPHGIFEISWEPELKELAELVSKAADVEYLEVGLEREGISKGSLEQRIIEFCILENPNALSKFLSIKQVVAISRELDLVRLERLSHHDKESLWSAVLARTG
ncbi:MAG: hypothetical protein ACFFER_15570, partial [Candidatus Thorarchaeota archaeon]